MSSDNDKMTVVILFQYVIDYIILTMVLHLDLIVSMVLHLVSMVLQSR